MQDDHMLKAALDNGAIPDGYRKVEAEFFLFKNPGDTISGRLIAKGTQKAGNSTVGKYTLSVKGNQRVSFMGSARLDEQMGLITIGHDIIVRFTHTEPSTDKSKNDTKFFDVYAKTPGKTEL